MKSAIESGKMVARLSVLAKLGNEINELVYDGWGSNDVVALQDELERWGWERASGTICPLSKDGLFRHEKAVVFTMASDILGSFISVRVYA
jgi:hypothetical protein